MPACGGGEDDETADDADDQADDAADDTGGLEVTLSSIQTNIFTPTCARSGCHSGGSPTGGLNLEEGSAFGNLVDVDSTEADGLKRVAPGEPDLSYLINKLEGTAGSVGGTNTQMPRGATPLDQATIDLIRQWIEEGAPDN